MFYDFVSGINYPYSDYFWQSVAGKTADTGKNFGEILQDKAKVFPDGALILPEPADYNGYSYNMELDKKPKKDMTLDEYKQWFVHQMSKMPRSGYFMATFRGTTVIKEEALERMKKDADYEAKILNMLKKGYSVSGIYAGKAISYQVIGESEESTYGWAYPVQKQEKKKAASEADKETWWDKRQKRFHERMREQVARDQARTDMHSRLEREYYFQTQLVNSQRRHQFLMQSLNGEDGTAGSFLINPSMPAGTTIAYESLVKAYLALSRNSRTK